MSVTSLLVSANAISVLLLTGIVATIHVVHYPLFRFVGTQAYDSFMDGHRARISALIALPWAAEGVTSIWLAVAPPPGVSQALAVLGLVLAAVPVVITVGWAVPAHATLAEGFNPDVHRRLMRANGLRVVAWSLHAAVAVRIAVGVL